MTGIETLKFTKLTVISKYANRTALLDGGYGSTEEYKEALLQEYGVDGAMLLRDWQFIAGVGMGNGMSVTKFGAKQSDFTSLRQLLTIAYGGIDKGPYLILLLTREEIPEEFDTKPKKLYAVGVDRVLLYQRMHKRRRMRRLGYRISKSMCQSPH